VAALTSPRRSTRRLILQKARRHQVTAWLRPAGGTRFQGLFHSPRRGAFHRSLTVLVHYRSLGVLSLGRWSARLPARSRVSGRTHVTRSPLPPPRRLRGSHPLWRPVPAVFGCDRGSSEGAAAPSNASVQPPSGSAGRLLTPDGFGLGPVRSPLLRASSFFLGVLRCFTSPGAPPARAG
jgi:hypothetical protein